MNKTYIPNINTTKNNNTWYIIDAKNQNLGRLSTYIANILRGKNNINYTPYIENQIHIIVTNAKFINVTGQKRHQKIYKRHSGYPGGLKIENFTQLNERIPNRIIEKAIKGMLPKGPLGRKLFTKLKVYSHDQHPHIAQKPKILSIN
uniref:Ribosomal protein L13 n=1 Tax=Schimmelmannia schousboei TaxID=173468 RepID=A0A1C9C909_9FLOR|nr:ribosomal protein L13 [Schimmelmannia schousboei]AOM64861.1 ribosomal protein L13 [Schimmelmannia schousboei]